MNVELAVNHMYLLPENLMEREHSIQFSSVKDRNSTGGAVPHQSRTNNIDDSKRYLRKILNQSIIRGSIK